MDINLCRSSHCTNIPNLDLSSTQLERQGRMSLCNCVYLDGGGCYDTSVIRGILSAFPANVMGCRESTNAVESKRASRTAPRFCIFKGRHCLPLCRSEFDACAAKSLLLAHAARRSNSQVGLTADLRPSRTPGKLRLLHKPAFLQAVSALCHSTLASSVLTSPQPP